MNNYYDAMEEALLSTPDYNLNDYTVTVFGAGNTATLYQKCFEHEGIRPVYYIDNNKAKQGTEFHGVPVISVEQLLSLQSTFSKPVIILICSALPYRCEEIRAQLDGYGLTHVIADAIVFNKNRETIKKVYGLLEDDASKDTYAELIRARINISPVSETIVSNNQYFMPPQFFGRSENEIFVDIGAYVGDTVEEYLRNKSGVFGKIYAFEPDTLNFQALSCRSERLRREWGLSNERLTLVHGGVGARTEKKSFFAPPDLTGLAPASARLGATFLADSTEGAEEVMIYAIDDYFKEQNVSFIKADIESYELEMLRGAESVIKRDKPLLAICLYHNATDMFLIPMFVKELYKDYKIKIRHYRYSFMETILYAYALGGRGGGW